MKESIFIAECGRDAGKRFIIKKRPARPLLVFLLEISQCLLKACPSLPASELQQGLIFRAIAIASSLKDENATSEGSLLDIICMILKEMDAVTFDRLLNALMSDIQICPDKKNINVRQDLMDSDLEELPTIIKLCSAWFDLHLDFMKPAES